MLNYNTSYAWKDWFNITQGRKRSQLWIFQIYLCMRFTLTKWLCHTGLPPCYLFWKGKIILCAGYFNYTQRWLLSKLIKFSWPHFLCLVTEVRNMSLSHIKWTCIHCRKSLWKIFQFLIWLRNSSYPYVVYLTTCCISTHINIIHQTMKFIQREYGLKRYIPEVYCKVS